MKIYWKVFLYKMLQKWPTPWHLYGLYLENSLSVWAEIFSFFLTLFGLSTVKISAKSATSIEQGYA